MRTVVFVKNLGNDSNGRSYLDSGRIAISRNLRNVAELFFHELTHIVIEEHFPEEYNFPELKTRNIAFLRNAVQISGVPGNIEESFEEKVCEIVANETIHNLAAKFNRSDEMFSAEFIRAFEFSLNVHLDEVVKKMIQMYIKKWVEKNGDPKKIQPWIGFGWVTAYDLLCEYAISERILDDELLDDIFSEFVDEDEEEDDYY